jgi:peptidoglycan/LPS O-acetylase OafA/YrhL
MRYRLKSVHPPDQTRAIGVDALRGLAALAVCSFHWEHFAFGTSNDQQVLRLGLLGVELFFMISGYVILMVAMRESVAHFVVARVVRLYPAYLISVLLTAAYVLYVGKYSLTAVLVNATMLQSFVAIPNITNPYWTLAFEITFYMLLGIVLLMRRLPSIERISIGWLVAGLIYRTGFPQAMTLDDQRPLAQLGFILAAPQFTPFFVAGMMLFRWRARMLGKAGMLALVMAIAMTLLGRGDFAQVSGGVYFAAMCMMVVGLALASGLASRHPLLKAAATIGQFSYPLYLIHCTLANIALLIGAALGMPAFISVLASIVVSFSLSWLIHAKLELPIQSVYKTSRREAGGSPSLACGR